MEELKGCPFCGRAPIITDHIGCATEPEENQFYVVCPAGMDHHIRIGAQTKEEAVRLWNQRADLSKPIKIMSES